MASCSSSSSFIRLRLCFDYPPPAAFGCRMCWLLVDLNTCRVVADLESMIREKFDLSRGSILSLFIEDYYLPHTESVHVVRDNDSVRVKVDWLTQVNGHSSVPDSSSVKQRKRKAVTKDGQGENVVCLEKKRKKASEENVEEGAKWVLDDDRNKQYLEKCTKKRKKKNVERNCDSLTPKPAASPKKIPTAVDQKGKKASSKKAAILPATTQNGCCNSSSRSPNDEDATPEKTATETTRCAASTVSPHCKPAQTKSRTPMSSSSGTNNFANESTGVKSKSSPSLKANLNSPPSTVVTNCTQRQAAGINELSQNSEAKPSDLDCGKMQPVSCRPLQQRSHGDGSQSFWEGDERKFERVSGKSVLGKGRVDRGHNGSFESSSTRAEEQPHETESQTSTSVIIKNGYKSTPKLCYSSMPLLAAPPQVGQTIAFKLLELTENYTPEVSEYKEGKIMSFDPTTNQIELELSTPFEAPIEPGKFDLVYQNPDGSERVEFAVSRGSQVIERWETLLEPRLVIKI